MKIRYELLQRIHTSAQGEVWRARDGESGMALAVKHHHGPLLPAALLSLRHPHLVPVLEQADGIILMPWIADSTLEKHGKLEAPCFSKLVQHTLTALTALHGAGLLHLDLKPENLFVSDLGFLISDFGSTRLIGDARADLKGSVHSMAPECFEGAELDQRTDLYALGCLFYFALTGKDAFQGDLSPQVITAHLQHRVDLLPGPLGAWIDRLMARHPQDRPPSAEAALAESASLLSITS